MKIIDYIISVESRKEYPDMHSLGYIEWFEPGEVYFYTYNCIGDSLYKLEGTDQIYSIDVIKKNHFYDNIDLFINDVFENKLDMMEYLLYYLNKKGLSSPLYNMWCKYWIEYYFSCPAVYKEYLDKLKNR